LTRIEGLPILLHVARVSHPALLLAFLFAFPSLANSQGTAGAGRFRQGDQGWLSGFGPPDSNLDGGFDARLAYLAALGPRTEGSQGERDAALRIVADIESSGLHPSMSPLDNLVDDQSDAVAVSVSIPGKRRDLLAFIVPLDTEANGPSGEGDAAIALMLCELQRIGAAAAEGRVPPIGIEVVFLPAVRRYAANGSIAQGPGAGWWLAGFDSANPTAVVYLSIDSVPGRFELINGERGLLSPWWLFDRAKSALDASGLPVDIFPNRMQGYRLGILESPGLLTPYLDYGIPAIEVEGATGEVAAGAALRSFTSFFEGFVEANATGFIDTWDRDYSSFRLGSLVVQIREGPYMVFLLCFAAGVATLILFFSLRRRSLIPRFLAKLPHRLLNLGLLALIAAASVLLSLGCQWLEGSLFGTAAAWKVAPAFFASTRLIVSIFSFLGFLSFAVSMRWISPDPWFYEIAALVLFGIDILVFAFLSLPLSFYFCWGFIVILASSFVRRKLASLVAAVMMIVPIGLVVLEMLRSPFDSALNIIIAPDPIKGILLVLAIVPFATMFASPLLFLAPRGIGRRRVAAAVFLALSAIPEMAALYVVSARSGSQPIALSETFDQDTSSWTARLESDVGLSSLALSRNGIPEAISTFRGQSTLVGKDSAKPISARLDTRDFLGRRNHFIVVTFPRAPDSMVLRLTSLSQLAIYDCSLPYRVDLDGLGASIFAGPGKGERLAFTLTTEAAFSARLSVEADFAGGIADWRTEGTRPLKVLEERIEASFDLRSPSS